MRKFFGRVVVLLLLAAGLSGCGTLSLRMPKEFRDKKQTADSLPGQVPDKPAEAPAY